MKIRRRITLVFRCSRLIINFVLLIIVVFCPGLSARAAVILDDTFADTAQINFSKSSASVDLVNAWVQLPGRVNPNILAVKSAGNAFAVATPDGVRVFEFDGAGIQENSLMAGVGGNSVSALAFNPDGTSIWVLNGGNLDRYDYMGAGLVLNSSLSLTGLANVISLSAQSSAEALVLLSQSDSGTGVLTYYAVNESGELQRAAGLSFDTGIPDPVAVAVVPGSMDLVYATANSVYYYVLEAVSGSYVLNPFLSKSGLSDIISVSAGAVNEYAVLKTASVEFYKYDQNYGLGICEEYGTVLAARGISLAVKQGGRGYLVFDSTGTVKHHVSDAGTGMMKEVPALRKSSLTVPVENFWSPALYQSIQKNLPQPADSIRLTVYEDNDPGTWLTYQYSLNSGVSWSNINPGAWVPISPSTSFVLRAVLTSSSNSMTPRLLRISLEGTKLTLGNLVITEIAMPPPGQTVPTKLFPAEIRAGAEFAFQIETAGYAAQVSAAFSGREAAVLMPVNAGSVDANVWQGTFVAPRDGLLGHVYQIDITAISGITGETKSTLVTSFVIINGSVLQTLKVRLLCYARNLTRPWYKNGSESLTV